MRQGLIERNPLTDSDCYLRASTPQRSFLQLDQVEASFAAARELEGEHRGLGWAEARAIRASTEPAVLLAQRYTVSDTLVRKIRRGELWGERPERRRNDVARLAIVATLALAGPRISELCLLDGKHVDSRPAAPPDPDALPQDRRVGVHRADGAGAARDSAGASSRTGVGA